MIVVLVGYPGSQRIVPACRYLTRKYLPPEFDRVFLNYQGPVARWCSWLASFLSYLPDEWLVFALDDYLLAAPLDVAEFKLAAVDLFVDPDRVCVKLCPSSEAEHAEYPITTQYALWRREALIAVLGGVDGSPWDFEIRGSAMFPGRSALRTCLKYFTNSSISARWDGIRLDGLSGDDIVYLQNNRLL